MRNSVSQEILGFRDTKRVAADGEKVEVLPEQRLLSQKNIFKRTARILAKTTAYAAAIGGTLTGIGILDVATGLVSQLVKPIEASLRNADLLEPGNSAQILLKTREFYAKAFQNPDDQIAHDAFVSWVKFNVGVRYSFLRGDHVAAKLAEQYLYGEGEEFDISQIFLANARASLKQLFSEDELKIAGITTETSDLDIVKILFENIFMEEPITRMVSHVVWEGEAVGTQGGVFAQDIDNEYSFIVGKPTQELVGKRVKFFTIGYIAATSIGYGLGSFTASVEGTVIDVENGVIELKDPQIKIRDRYDFESTDLRAITHGWTILEELGLGVLIESPLFEEFKYQRFIIEDEDGVLLAEQKYAQDFDVVGQLFLQGTFKIANTQLLPPP